MPPTVGQRTFGQVVVEVARQRGLVLAQGTATAGSGTTLTDATNMRLPTANANDIVGRFLYIWGGTSAGTVREITSYGTIGVFTWTGTATTPDTTSTWVLLSIDPQRIIDAILKAQRVLSFDSPLRDEWTCILTNSLLGPYGDMEEWANGTTSAPDGWTLAGAGGTIARVALADVSATSLTIGHGLYAAAVTPGAGAVATLTRQIPYAVQRYMASQTLTVSGLLAESAAADVVVRISTTSSTGTGATTDWTGTHASYRWEELSDISTQTVTVPTSPYGLSVQCRFAAAANVGYVDDLGLYGPTLYLYDLPGSLLALEPTIWVEAASVTGARASNARVQEHFPYSLTYGEDWMLSPRSSTTARQLRLLTAQPDGHHLYIKGLRSPAVVTASSPTTNLNLDADQVAAVASRFLGGDPEREILVDAAKYARSRSGARGRPYIWVETTSASP